MDKEALGNNREKKENNATAAQDVQVQQHIHCIFICLSLNLKSHFEFNNLSTIFQNSAMSQSGS